MENTIQSESINIIENTTQIESTNVVELENQLHELEHLVTGLKDYFFEKNNLPIKSINISKKVTPSVSNSNETSNEYNINNWDVRYTSRQMDGNYAHIRGSIYSK